MGNDWAPESSYPKQDNLVIEKMVILNLYQIHVVDWGGNQGSEESLTKSEAILGGLQSDQIV